MHLKDDLLRAYLDRETTQEQTRLISEHLAHCATCQAKLVGMRDRAALVRGQMEKLTPNLGEQARSPQTAYARFAKNHHYMHDRKESIQTMLTRRPLWTALAVIAILAIALSLTPVRAWASDMLGIFRVQKVTVVQFDPNAAENAKASLNANQEVFEQLFKENVKITDKGELQHVNSASEAAAAAGFTPRLPADLKGAQLEVKPGLKGELKIDQPQMQALLDSAGVNAQLPKEVDGKMIVADVSSTVVTSFGCPAESAMKAERDLPKCTILMQMPSPVVDAPDGINVQQFGAAMFQFLGLPEDEAVKLSQKIDWTTTLVLPIPQGSGIEYQDMTVDGVTGTYIKSLDEPGYMLVWVKDGIIYGLSGPDSVQNGLSLVETLQ